MKKRILALVLAVILTMALSTAVLAANQTGLTITVNSEYSGRSYTAYQIFSGDVESNTDGDSTGNGNDRKLSNIQWATGVDGTGILNAVIALSNSYVNSAATAAGVTLSSTTTAADFAKVLSGITDTDTLISIAKIFNANKGTSAAHTSGAATVVSGGYAYEITGLDAGYYIVVDTSTLGTGEAASAILLNVVGNTSVTEKVSKPTVDKSVEETTDTYNTGYADHAINESFKFKLTATLAADPDYAAYSAYKVVFHDTPSVGITYEDIVSVVIEGKDSSGSDVTATVPAYDSSTAPNGYKAAGDILTAPDGDGTKQLVITIEDLKTTVPTLDLKQGTTVTVIYSAHLNAAAEVEPVGTTNDATANKNTVVLEYSNDPNGTGTGSTAGDDVYVFTFEVDNNKWAGPGTKVDDPATVVIDATATPEAETLANTLKTSWVDTANNKFYEKNGSDWYRMDALSGAGFTLYSDSAKTTAIKLIDNGDGTYTVADQSAASGVVTEMTSEAATGKFNIKGLDAGTYYLAETTIPAGYNTAADITITVTATYDDTTTPVTVTTTSSTNVDNEIVDNSGTQLPSTGGIGTTIFYIVGSILVLGAGVVLVTRKRAGSAD